LRQIEKVDVGSRRQPLRPVVITTCGELEAGDDGVVVGDDGDPFTPWPQVCGGFGYIRISRVGCHWLPVTAGAGPQLMRGVLPDCLHPAHHATVATAD